jgi:hypothetical protein
MQRLKITAVTYTEVDETDTQAWNLQDGSPADIMLRQLQEGEVYIEEIAEAHYNDEDMLNVMTFTVEVVDA